MTIEKALMTLEQAGFRTAPAPAPAGSGPPGTVVAQSPPSGSAPRDSLVTIEVVEVDSASAP
jgi:beta-lactam-binding protein with PASTA domain